MVHVGLTPNITTHPPKYKIKQRQVLLEWDYSKGDPPAPLVKDKYGSERRKVRMYVLGMCWGVLGCDSP